MPNADPPSTSFEVFQEADEFIVFVFDVSGSMSMVCKNFVKLDMCLDVYM